MLRGRFALLKPSGLKFPMEMFLMRECDEESDSFGDFKTLDCNLVARCLEMGLSLSSACVSRYISLLAPSLLSFYCQPLLTSISCLVFSYFASPSVFLRWSSHLRNGYRPSRIRQITSHFLSSCSMKSMAAIRWKTRMTPSFALLAESLTPPWKLQNALMSSHGLCARN